MNGHFDWVELILGTALFLAMIAAGLVVGAVQTLKRRGRPG